MNFGSIFILRERGVVLWLKYRFAMSGLQFRDTAVSVCLHTCIRAHVCASVGEGMAVGIACRFEQYILGGQLY